MRNTGAEPKRRFSVKKHCVQEEGYSLDRRIGDEEPHGADRLWIDRGDGVSPSRTLQAVLVGLNILHLDARKKSTSYDPIEWRQSITAGSWETRITIGLQSHLARVIRSLGKISVRTLFCWRRANTSGWKLHLSTRNVGFTLRSCLLRFQQIEPVLWDEGAIDYVYSPI